jgi:hypothetical protein
MPLPLVASYFKASYTRSFGLTLKCKSRLRYEAVDAFGDVGKQVMCLRSGLFLGFSLPYTAAVNETPGY